MAFRVLMLWFFFAYNCCAYPTFKSQTASAGKALPQWESVASSENGKYRADMGIGYQANNSGSWECKLVVENVISESTEKSYACSMAEGYGQDFCSLVVLDGCVMLLSNQDKALVCSLTDYQVANYQYLAFKLDNYGTIYFDFSLSPPPPSAPSSSRSSGSKISLKTIAIVAAGVFLIIAACLILKVCYSNHRKECNCQSCESCEEEKKKKEEKEKKEKEEKEKKCCCECKCKECEVREQKITYYHYYCPNTYHYCTCPY